MPLPGYQTSRAVQWYVSNRWRDQDSPIDRHGSRIRNVRNDRIGVVCQAGLTKPNAAGLLRSQ